jgi:D-alanyl-D-alanine carboxypeptidase
MFCKTILTKAMLLCTALALTSFFVSQTVSASPTSKLELPFAKQLQDVLDNGLKKYNGKGISAAVIVPGYKTWVGVNGVSHENIPIKADTLFDAGSITKNFVAALTLKLVEQGLLTLDDPLHKWLSDYPNIDNTITIRQLLNHTSGLYGLQGRSAIRPILKDPGRLWTPKEVLTTLVGKPHFPKGKGWQYSNTGYLLLGMIIEKATGSKISTELRNRFWNPLGLDSTFLAIEEVLPANIAHGWIDINGDKALDDFSVFPRTALYSVFKGAGGVYSTPEDLAKWTHALFHEGKVVSKGSLDQMVAFHSPIPKPIITGYGLGVERYKSRFFNGSIFKTGRKEIHLELWGHAGNGPGYFAFIWYLPEYGVSIGLISNREQTQEGYILMPINDLMSVITTNLEKVH